MGDMCSIPPLLGITYGLSKALPKNSLDANTNPMPKTDLPPPHMGEKLRLEAQRLGLKPTAVAALFGVKTPSVYDWYKDGRIDRKHFQRLVDWSGRTIEWWLDLRPAAADGGGSVADPFRSARAVLDDVPPEYRRRAVHDALLAIAAWVSPETAPATAAPQAADGAASTSVKSHSVPASGRNR